MILSFPQYLVKLGERSTAEKYMPWYGSAALGTTGSLTAQKLVPKKFKLPAAVAGSLAGAGAGVHGGEAVGRLVGKKKTAEEKEQKPPTVTGTVLKGLAGLGLGTVAGYGAGRGIEYLGKGRVHKAVPYIASAAGAGLGAAYPLWKAYEIEALRRAVEAKKKKKKEGK